MGDDAGRRLEPPRLGFKRKKDADETARAPEKESRPRLLTSVVRRVATGPADQAEDSSEPTRRLDPVQKAKPARAVEAAKEPQPAREAPISDGPLAAALTGLAVGVFLVVAVWVCEQISQQSRGTTSLGRAGIPLLLAIFVLAVVGGALLLRLAKTPSPGSISFLATALVAVLTVLFLGDHDTIWAGVAVVVLSVAAFLLSRWVTVRYIDTDSGGDA